MTEIDRRRAVGLFASAVAVILCVTVAPEPPGTLCEASAGSTIANVALFVPLGAAAMLLGLGPWRAVAVGLVLSGAIELLQLGVISGRCTSLLDVATNTAGALIGAWAGPRLTVSPRLARRLTVAGVIVVPLIWLVTARWQQPHTPEGAGVLRLPAAAGDGPRVVAVRVDGVTSTAGPLPAWETWRQGLRRHEIAMDFSLRGTGPARWHQQLADVGLVQLAPTVMLEARRDTLLLRLNTPGEMTGIVSARIALPGALPLRSETATAGLTLADGQARFTLVDGDLVRQGVLRTDVNWGWEWLTPLQIRGRTAALWATIAWLATVFGTLGFLAQRAEAEGSSWRLWLVGAVLVVVLAGTPALLHLERATAVEWLVAATALAWGAGLAGGAYAPEPARGAPPNSRRA